MTTYGVDRGSGASGSGSSSTVLLADGSVPLTGHWLSGSLYYVSAGGFDFARVAANPGDTDTLWLSDGTSYEAGTLVWENKLVVLGEASFGAPGYEQGSITVNGAAFDANVKINQYGGTYDAALILHRHSTTDAVSGNIVFAKAATDDATHAAVANGETLGAIHATGHDGTDYALGATVSFVVNGAPGANDMPTDIVFAVSPDGSQTPAERFRVIAGTGAKVTGALEVTGAASIGSISSLGTIDAKGDLLVGTADNTVARQAVGSDGQQIIADSAQTNGIAYASQQIGKNAVINGAFDIWQRGTSFAAIATSTYSADRWVWLNGSAGVVTISRDTDVPTVANAGVLFNYSLKVAVTTADASVAAGDVAAVTQRIEGFVWRNFAQRALVLSFWVKSAKTGTHCVSIRNSGGDRSYVGTYTVNAANTWEKKTVTFSASPSAGTWDYTTGIGASLDFCLMAGSTYQTTAGAWQTGNYLATSAQANVLDTNANAFFIAGVQLEVGSVATDFEIRPYPVELAMCRRYCQIVYGTSYSAVGQAIAADTAYCPIRLTTSMRTTPTSVTLLAAAGSGAGQMAFCNSGGNFPATIGTHSVASQGQDTVMLQGSGYTAGFTAGDASLVYVQGTNTAMLRAEAEL